jgi:hypothetical protein
MTGANGNHPANAQNVQQRPVLAKPTAGSGMTEPGDGRLK